ncbi:50S ribosomal protein L7ae [Candidatus Woesearchaeota archaeon]|nr:50S ribosomal protein L7ae [Candidatus Woesearchaeota archaeon]
MEQASKETAEKVLEAIEVAKATGKLKKGTNEVTKMIERGEAKLVALASDVNPPEITMHVPLLCKEKGVPCYVTGSKDELGAAAGLDIATIAVVIVQEGEAKPLIKELAKEAAAEAEPEEEKVEETPGDTPDKQAGEPAEEPAADDTEGKTE